MASTTCIGDVPDECLALAFECLHSAEDRGAAALTCRRWRKLEALSRHTLRFDLQRCQPQPTPQEEADFLYHGLKHALNAFPHIFRIFIDRFVHLPDTFFAVLQTEKLAHLTSLHLHFCLIITDQCLDYVATGCPALTSLTLSACFQITNIGLHAIARGIGSLEHLDVSRCKSVSDEGIDDVLGHCANMQSISFSYCGRVCGWGLRHGKNLKNVYAEACVLTDAGLMEGLEGATSIQIFNLADLRSGFRLRATGLGHLGTCGKQLKKLCLRMCRVLDDETVKKIAQGCPNLSVWDLSLCQDVSFEGWHAVALFCAKLQYLDVRRCRLFCDQSLIAMLGSCSSLRCIHVSLSTSLTHESCRGFEAIWPGVKIETQAPFMNCCHVT